MSFPRKRSHSGSSGEACHAPVGLLRGALLALEGRPYSQLHALAGRWFQLHPRGGPAVRLRWLHLQPDPFAPGSTCEVTLPLPGGVAAAARLPRAQFGGDARRAPYTAEEQQYYSACRQTAAEDFLLRRLWRGLAAAQQRPGSSDTSYYRYEGALQLARPSSFILPRSAVQISLAPAEGAAEGTLRFCLCVKLPGHGRRIDGGGAWRILEEELWAALAHSVLLPLPGRDYVVDGSLRAHIDLHHNTAYLRRHVTEELHGVAFIANGSCLPRARGHSTLPLTPQHVRGEEAAAGEDHPAAVLFQSPPSLEVTVALPNPVERLPSHPAPPGHTITGMLLPRGLTLIAGGGYHGKSTLLHALSTAVYNAAALDGRSYCVTDDMAVAVRAEEGRSVQQLDVSLFIEHLPAPEHHHRAAPDSAHFATQDASGSTSEAAAMLEAIELGARTLLLDEDTSASNLLARDDRMAALVPRAAEPIRTLREQLPRLKAHPSSPTDDRLSVVMVVGSSGSYFDLADVVLVMDRYRVRDATAQARAIAAGEPGAPPAGPAVALAAFNATRALDYARTFAPFQAPGGAAATPPLSKGAYYRQRYAKPTAPDELQQQQQEQQPLAPLKVTAHRGEALQLTQAARSSYHELTRGGGRTVTETVDVGALEQLVEEGQLDAIAAAVALLYDSGGRPLPPPPPVRYPPRLTAAARPLSPFAQLAHHLEEQLRGHRLEPPRRAGRPSAHPRRRRAAARRGAGGGAEPPPVLALSTVAWDPETEENNVCAYTHYINTNIYIYIYIHQ
ncbi:ABC transporter ATPase [Strigomonas culicis]|uniref:ABC transporter ATPase n=1 Tax=Strigomonas culicis TaxID=28005 RepID=S9VE68_9TRYP|nr:ABC transporter ATPase [Strigomonas culicis]|eukprot:EPY21405.1 ABC transporter ATPase [Strigomonas culicis]